MQNKGKWYKKNKANNVSVVFEEQKMQNKYRPNSIHRWTNMFLSVTLVGGENRDAVCGRVIK